MKTVKLATFIENPDNPYKATGADLARLKGKLERVPKGLRAMRLAYVTDHVARDGTSYQGKRVVISGNKRLRELKIIYGDAASVPAEWFCDCTDMTPEERREFIVSANTVDGMPDAEKLLEQYDREELTMLMGDEALEKILSEIGEAPQEVERFDDDGTGTVKKEENLVTFEGIKVPATHEEMETLKTRYYEYVDENQVAYGFIRHILEGGKND